MKKITAVLLGFMIVSTLNIFAFAETTERENYGYLPYVRESVKTDKKSGISLMGNSNVLPEKYDSRDFGYVSPVKNQGQTDSCWAHASIGVLESYMLKNYGKKDENGMVTDTAEFDFSENHMQYMISKNNNNPLGYETGTGANGGGNAFFAASYFLNDSGPVDDKDDPLKNYNTRDYSATKDIKKSAYKVDSVEFVERYLHLGVDSEKQALIDETKSLIMNYGAVTCGINSNYFSADNESLYCNKEAQKDKEGNLLVKTNHQVILVGWDDTYSKNNFKTAPETDGAFIAKNSWGATAHGDGFFYISYCDYYLLFDVMAVTKASKRAYNEILYNLDPYYPLYTASNWSYTYGDLYCPINCYGNIFERKTKNEALSGVRFYGYSEYTYKLYLIDSDSTLNKEQNLINFTNYNKRYLGSYSPEHNGYFTVNTQNIPITSDKFAVMLCVDSLKPISMPFEDNYQGFITRADYNEGESFCGSIQKDGLFLQFSHNFPIKAITKTDEPYAEFEFANFTDSLGTEKTNFSAGDTVYIVPALNGINLKDKEIICVGYKDNVLQNVMYKSISDKNRFQINNIPSDFSKWKFYMYIWEMNELKPICEGVSVGVQ